MRRDKRTHTGESVGDGYARGKKDDRNKDRNKLPEIDEKHRSECGEVMDTATRSSKITCQTGDPT